MTTILVSPDKMINGPLNHEKNMNECKVNFFWNNNDYHIILCNWLLELYNRKEWKIVRILIFWWQMPIVNVLWNEKTKNDSFSTRKIQIWSLQTLLGAKIQKVNIFHSKIKKHLDILIIDKIIPYKAFNRKDNKEYYVSNILEETKLWNNTVQKVKCFSIQDENGKYNMEEKEHYIKQEWNNPRTIIADIEGNYITNVWEQYNILWKNIKNNKVVGGEILQKVVCENNKVFFIKENWMFFNPFQKEGLDLIDIKEEGIEKDNLIYQKIVLYNNKTQKEEEYYITEKDGAIIHVKK